LKITTDYGLTWNEPRQVIFLEILDEFDFVEKLRKKSNECSFLFLTDYDREKQIHLHFDEHLISD